MATSTLPSAQDNKPAVIWPSPTADTDLPEQALAVNNIKPNPNPGPLLVARDIESPASEEERSGPRQTIDPSASFSAHRMIWISAILCLTTFCLSVDNTIVSTAIPQIVRDFNSIDDVGWYAAIYPLMSCAFQPCYSKIYILVSYKTVFLVALVIFEAGSATRGSAPNSDMFIFGRALAGLGSAGISAGGTLIIAECVPLRQRPTYNSIIGSIFAVGSVVGPLMGGAFSDTSTWRWSFYINLPIGGIVMLCIVFFYNHRARDQTEPTSSTITSKLARFDAIGTLIFISACVCILLALTWGGSRYAWNNVHSFGLITAGGILFAIFINIEHWMKDSATVPLRLLSKRSIMAGLWFGLCLGGLFFVNVFYIPLWFQLVDDRAATKSAILFIPFMVSVVGGFMIAGFLTTATGYYTPIVWASSVFMSVGAGLLTTVHVQGTSRAEWIGYQIICGLGVGMREEQGLYMVQTILSENDVATGVGIILFSITLGGALFVAVAQAVFLDSITRSLRLIDPNIDPQSTLLPGSANVSATPELQHAYGQAIKSSFRVGLILATTSFLGAVFYDWNSLTTRSSESEHELESTRQTHE